ncbi:GNAT family N-acetyltransferase [Nocardia sp. CC201C]|uniref:GNAT family N-acetyltransferase n=1 Tax=Nocardia sp. CC201C TaxID=3044575 RepID=UPI0024A81A21|nr:GNAT family N-acetyltransferase [Nocardia sp. CC201C]
MPDSGIDRIRATRETDRPDVVRLLHATWRAAFAPHLPPSSSDAYVARRIAENYVAERWAELAVAERGGRVVGMVYLEGNLVAALHVEPASWGRGVGRRLLAWAERRAFDGGERVLRLQVEDFNARAVELYQRAGWTELVRRPDTELGSGGKSITMGKVLDTEGLRLRPYDETDRAGCLALFDGNVPEFFAPRERDDFVEFLDDLHGPYLVGADTDGRLVACGGLQADDEDATVAVLCWGMVDRTRHGSGFGRELLAARLDLIAAADFEQVTIETTPMSRGFFERVGFRALRTEPDGFAPGYDLVEMALVLAERMADDRPGDAQTVRTG